MNLIVVGASAGLGRAISEEAARRHHNLLLVAGDARDLAALTASLRLRYGIRADYAVCDFGEEPAFGTAGDRLAPAIDALGPVDGILYPIGFARGDDNGSLDAAATLRLMRINFLGQSALTSALWSGLIQRERACVVGFGSVAAIRGRGRNVIYTAAKVALSSYFESLRHLAADSNIRVHFYQLGFMETPRTHAMKLPLPKGSVTSLARLVFDRLDRDSGPVIYPRFWILVSLVLRSMPWFLFRRMRF